MARRATSPPRVHLWSYSIATGPGRQRAAGAWRRCRAAGALGYAASAQELLQRFVGIARTDMYKTVFAELGREMPRGLLEEREKRVWQRCHSDLRTVPGVEEALEALRQQPKCVASSSLPAKLQLKLESTGLAGTSRRMSSARRWWRAASRRRISTSMPRRPWVMPPTTASLSRIHRTALPVQGRRHARHRLHRRQPCHAAGLPPNCGWPARVMVVDHMDGLPKAIESVGCRNARCGLP